MQPQGKKINLMLWTIDPNSKMNYKKKKICHINTFNERGYKDIVKRKIEMKNTNSSISPKISSNNQNFSKNKKRHDKRTITDVLNLSINTSHTNANNCLKTFTNNSIDNINTNSKSFIQTTNNNLTLRINNNNTIANTDIKTPTSYYNHTFTKNPQFKRVGKHQTVISTNNNHNKKAMFYPSMMMTNIGSIQNRIKKIKPTANLNFFKSNKKITSSSSNRNNRSNNSNTSNSNNTSTNNTSNNNLNANYHNISTNYTNHTPKTKKALMTSSMINRSTDDIKMNKNNYNDDLDGNYMIVIGEFLLNRYEIISTLGKGSFGQAVKCYDHFNKEYVCIKIIKNKPKFTSQSQIEIEILKFLNSHDTKKYSNIVSLKNHFTYKEHICLVFELLSINLYEVIQANNYIGFDLLTIKKFATQILFSLLLLKKYKIIHCDLKPENILLITNGKTGIKLIDFGSSCFSHEKLYTYIQSRFYRAPEVLLGLGYDVEIDMWSLGCILCELYMGYPIFPGEDEYDMIYYIMEYFGKPPYSMIDRATKRDMFFNENGDVYERANSFGKIRRPNTKKLENFLVNADNDFISFVSECLQWEPSERITPEEALKHKWICSEMPKDVLKIHYKKIKEMGNAVKISNPNSHSIDMGSSKISNSVNNNFNLTFNVHIDFGAHLNTQRIRTKNKKTNKKY